MLHMHHSFRLKKIRALMLDQLRREPYFSGTHIQYLTTNCTKFNDVW